MSAEQELSRILKFNDADFNDIRQRLTNWDGRRAGVLTRLYGTKSHKYCIVIKGDKTAMALAVSRKQYEDSEEMNKDYNRILKLFGKGEVVLPHHADLRENDDDEDSIEDFWATADPELDAFFGPSETIDEPESEGQELAAFKAPDLVYNTVTEKFYYIMQFKGRKVRLQEYYSEEQTTVDATGDPVYVLAEV